ncbi:hypothetical protein EFA46_008160 [Halarchaeum sp. CBA1220]|uniref:hypothetical protein n=1 Tax=Halarchaeum sp. CBA1220 TaxID=1853682 RepID=UPI000F3A8A67|nr:hypothetical protein [Halarchaeum sp. CBA1220]QLC34178.1 hypothetical protein EFA46_008160 [Halarchaeum sp. CBA1220]
MSDASAPGGGELRSADRTILEFLADGAPQYAAVIAQRTGIHTPYAERRCEALVRTGHLEPVTGEVVYRITARGEDAIGRLPD